jgi:hypothetical protein
MKTKVVVAALTILLALSSCRCTAERAAVDRLQEQQEKIFVKYTAYVAQDQKLDGPAKNDELLLLKSLRDITTSLKKSLGD